jgi:hypothetical protein
MARIVMEGLRCRRRGSVRRVSVRLFLGRRGWVNLHTICNDFVEGKWNIDVFLLYYSGGRVGGSMFISSREMSQHHFVSALRFFVLLSYVHPAQKAATTNALSQEETLMMMKTSPFPITTSKPPSRTTQAQHPAPHALSYTPSPPSPSSKASSDSQSP